VLVLLSFALVLAATVLLVLGLLNDDGLTLIYASIACSAAAAVVLIVALRRHKPIAEVEVAPPALPSDATSAPAAAPVAAEAPVAAAASGEWQASDLGQGQVLAFPIADYDDLTAGQILPLLPQLYPEEIGIVEARERVTKARPEILDRLAELRGDEPAAAVTAVAASPPATVAEWEDDWFPIEDYESLTVAQIRPLLRELDGEELILVRDREMALGRRRSLLADIDRRLGTPPGEAQPTEAPAAEAATPAEEAGKKSH
jgi:hypothetical protein